MAKINNPPVSEQIVDVKKDGMVRRAWAQWFAQVFAGSAFLGAGATIDRPSLSGVKPGAYYFDTSLGANGKPVFVRKDGLGWVLADGTAA